MGFIKSFFNQAGKFQKKGDREKIKDLLKPKKVVVKKVKLEDLLNYAEFLVRGAGDKDLCDPSDLASFTIRMFTASENKHETLRIIYRYKEAVLRGNTREEGEAKVKKFHDAVYNSGVAKKYLVREVYTDP